MTLEYCADAIALYHGKLVLVERLNTPTGLALPGGRRDTIHGTLEDVASCAIREFQEETGLVLVIHGQLGVYDAPDRDPRGPKISTVVYGVAYGTIRDELYKTKVFLLDLEQLDAYKEQFAFDHYTVIKDWLGQKYQESKNRY